MAKGDRRSLILDVCPDDFHETLKSWIDEIEDEVGGIVSLLEIKDVGDLGQIEDAKNETENLADSLY
jgi:hypothetical protein